MNGRTYTDMGCDRSEKTFCRTLLTDLDAFDELKDDIIGLTGMSPAVFNIILACEEIFVNIVEYSCAKTADVAVTLNNDRLTVCFADCGIAFDPLSTSIEEKGFDELDDGGMGIMLVRKIASECSYTRTSEKNILRLVFNL